MHPNFVLRQRVEVLFLLLFHGLRAFFKLLILKLLATVTISRVVWGSWFVPSRPLGGYCTAPLIIDSHTLSVFRWRLEGDLQVWELFSFLCLFLSSLILIPVSSSRRIAKLFLGLLIPYVFCGLETPQAINWGNNSAYFCFLSSPSLKYNCFSLSDVQYVEYHLFILQAVSWVNRFFCCIILDGRRNCKHFFLKRSKLICLMTWLTQTASYDNRGVWWISCLDTWWCSRILPRDQLWHQQQIRFHGSSHYPLLPLILRHFLVLIKISVFSALHKNYTKLFKYAALLFVPNRRFW